MNRKQASTRASVSTAARGMLSALALACACLAAPSFAGETPSVLFIGNSFTAGMHAATWRYRASTVHDLNHDGVGGVPALFELFAEESGLKYTVSVETLPGKGLADHYQNRKSTLDQRWDTVVMQEYSTLDPHNPGDPQRFDKYARRLARLFAARNPGVNVWLLATWSRPDMTYRKNSPWHGRPIIAMAEDLQKAYAGAAQSSPYIRGVIPVGRAFNRAIAEGVADPDPYDGIDYGKVNLWAYDNHHASVYGYYLEALMDYAVITGRDPRKLGGKEQAAVELGLSTDQAEALQKVAYEQAHGQ